MRYKILMALMIVGLMLIPLSCHQQQEIPPRDWVVTNETEFLAKCEHCDIPFERHEFGDTVTYYYQRMIGNASVEFDNINYWFDKDTGNFENKIVHWRDDLPDTLPPIISGEEAMAIGGGTRADLVYISPESDVFASVKPTPENPCWAVSVYDDEGWNIDIVVVDAVTGEILGHGVPVP